MHKEHSVNATRGVCGRDDCLIEFVDMCGGTEGEVCSALGLHSKPHNISFYPQYVLQLLSQYMYCFIQCSYNWESLLCVDNM